MGPDRGLQPDRRLDHGGVEFRPLLRVAVAADRDRLTYPARRPASATLLPLEAITEGPLDLGAPRVQPLERPGVLVGRGPLDRELDRAVVLACPEREHESAPTGASVQPRVGGRRHAREQAALRLRECQQGGPELLAILMACGRLLLLLTDLTDFGARPSDEGQQRCRIGLPDPYGLHLHEIEPGGTALVEPSHRPDVLGPGVGHDPNGDVGAACGDVGDQLAEVVVVARTELVLDHHDRTFTGLARDVDPECARRLFRR